MGRGATGVWGIKLDKKKDDVLVGMLVADPDGFLLTLCELGFGKRTPFGANTAGELDETSDEDTTPESESSEPTDDDGDATSESGAKRYRKQRRGGKGVKDIKVTAKNGKVVGIASVRETDEIMVVTTQGMVVRTKVSDIRIVGRNTQGVTVMKLNEGDRIKTLAKLAAELTSQDDAELPE
jgi:DNA gyrase subunit A